MKEKGMIIVLSAPSGAGKSTIYKKLLKSLRNITYSISTTTRQPRKGEKNGKDYFFVSVSKFKEMVKQKKFVEWAVVHGNLYGTSHDFLAKTLAKGKDVVMDIDVAGAMSLKKHYKDAVLIFIMAPSFKELEKRLTLRGKDTKEVVKKRLLNARKEVKFMPKYDYLVLNDDLNTAVGQVKGIIESEKLKVARQIMPV